MAPLIRQVFDPEQNICTVRAKEAFGEDWRRNLTEPSYSKAGGKIKTALVNNVKRSLNMIDIGTTQQSPIVLVFAVALCPQHEPVDWLLTYLEHQELIKANANVTVDSLKVISGILEKASRPSPVSRAFE